MAELPPESQLPRPVVEQAAGGEAVEPPPNALPDEGELPRPQAAGRGAVDVGDSPDGIPWLRLNARGHTAPVRAVCFADGGRRLCTAGDDKVVLVWRRDGEGGGPRWRYERTIRWQVQRGTRGRVYALASAPGLLAIAGEGAMAGTGEIVLVDPRSGEFVASLFDQAVGHRQVVVALAFAAPSSGPVLVSQSMDGRVISWAKDDVGLWKATLLRKPDSARGAPAVDAERLIAGRAFCGVGAKPDGNAVAGVPVTPLGDRVRWRLSELNAKGGASSLGDQASRVHFDAVTAIAVSADGSRMVTADGAGAVWQWDLKANPPSAVRLPRPRDAAAALGLAISPEGARVVIGTAAVPDRAAAAVEHWDLGGDRPRRVQRSEQPANVLACAVNAAGDVAIVRGNGVAVGRFGKPPSKVLKAKLAEPMRVAFPQAGSPYHLGVALGRNSGRAGAPVIDRVFDSNRLRIAKPEGGAHWRSTDAGRGPWRVKRRTNGRQQLEWRLTNAGRDAARLPLAAARTGVPTALAWAAADSPLAIVGASAGDIYVYQTADAGDAPILRRYRGHASAVISLAVSRDSQLLASASTDGTIRFWPLGKVLKADASVNRWGAEFVNVEGQGVEIASIEEAGPLYFRGARRGDQLRACEVLADGKRKTINDPAEQLAAVTQSSFDRVIRFELQTGRQPPRSLQILPAWQPLASLVIDTAGEWAYWAPSGYYDASFEGHRLFGWQVNRGLDELPDFFLAARFRALLERPAVMSRLLRSGSIDQAFRAADAGGPGDPSRALASVRRLMPRVSILSPAAGSELTGDGAPTLEAEVTLVAGQTLRTPRAFCNGVPAEAPTLVSRSADAEGETMRYRWRLAAPSDERVLVRVLAATDEGLTATADRVMANRITKPTRKPRLTLLGVGVGKYRDPQVPPLTSPARSVREVQETLRRGAASHYDVDAITLLEREATRARWEAAAERIADRLRADARPDDLLVVMLSGHGVQDPNGGGYQFLTAAADYAEVMAGGYADCLSLEDFAPLADLPCRKLVVLDTCHSGAIQPMRHREIKSAVRQLQQGVVMTLAASQGGEEAIEGRFAQRLLEGLRGAADGEAGDADGVVRLDELVAYVRRTVAEDSLRQGFQQTPAAGPPELLELVRPPLTAVSF